MMLGHCVLTEMRAPLHRYRPQNSWIGFSDMPKKHARQIRSIPSHLTINGEVLYSYYLIKRRIAIHRLA